ncbi:MAG: HEAT repeat domain-containing protein [Alphaproteobacteria bacterium]|nr:HEAT repeat domain-containing protein [Alphaproteobacteria bacterium]
MTTPWSIDGERIVIAAEPGTDHDLHLVYRTSGEGAVSFRREHGALQVWALSSYQSARAWFPTWDHPSERFTMRTTLVTPRGLGSWGVGRRVGRADLPDGRASTTWTLDRPVPSYVVAFVVGDLEERALGNAVWELVPGGGPAPFHAVLADVPAHLGALEALLGRPHPWGELRLAPVAGLPVSGMENPGLITLDDQLPDRHRDWVVVHELAHQWLGDRVGPGAWRDLWLSEGLASWAEHRITELRDPGEAADELRSAAHHGPEDHAVAPRDGTLPAEWVREEVYGDGLVAMHQLEALLGRETVDRAVRDHLARDGDGIASTDAFRECLERASGRSLGPWFDTWIHGERRPRIRTRWWWDAGERFVEISWDGAGPPVEVAVEIDGRRAETIQVGPGLTRWSERSETPPRYVRVDPDGVLLGARWTRDQPVEAWVAQLERSPLSGRLEAVQALAWKVDGAPALARVVDDASEPAALRRFAVHALATTDAPEANQTLLAQLRDDRSPELRRVVAAAIGAREALPDLRSLATRDDDPELAAAALEGLARLDGPEAARLARGVLDGPPTVQSAAIRALGVGGAPEDLDRVLRFVDPTVHRSTCEDALQAARRLVARGARTDRLQVVLVRGTTAADASFRALVFDALGEVGDRDALRALQRAAESTTLSWLAERARGAVRAIEDRIPETR